MNKDGRDRMEQPEGAVEGPGDELKSRTAVLPEGHTGDRVAISPAAKPAPRGVPRSVKPAVSVVIPLYNKGDQIRRALDSVLHQTVQDFEVIVADDGSTDSSAEVVEAYKAEHPDQRIKLLRQENGGPGVARNTGIMHSSANLIAFLDADDTWCPGFLQAILSLAQAYPQAGLLASGYRTLHRHNVVTGITVEPGRGQVLIDDYFKRARVASIVSTPATAVRRNVFEAVGCFAHDRKGQDRDMWGRIALRYPIAYDCSFLVLVHTDAKLRVTTRRDHALAPSPFVKSARRALAQAAVAPEQVESLSDYIDLLWLEYIDRCIRAGNRQEVLRTLREELADTRAYKVQVTLLRIAARAMPLPLLYKLRTLPKSRWATSLRGEYRKNGVITRIGRVGPGVNTMNMCAGGFSR